MPVESRPLFRSVIDQPAVLKFRVVTAGLPLQNFGAVRHLFVPGWTFGNDRDDLLFGHSGLQLREPLVHLTADAQQKRGTAEKYLMDRADFTNCAHVY